MPSKDVSRETKKDFERIELYVAPIAITNGSLFHVKHSSANEDNQYLKNSLVRPSAAFHPPLALRESVYNSQKLMPACYKDVSRETIDRKY